MGLSDICLFANDFETMRCYFCTHSNEFPRIRGKTHSLNKNLCRHRIHHSRNVVVIITTNAHNASFVSVLVSIFRWNGANILAEMVED